MCSSISAHPAAQGLTSTTRKLGEAKTSEQNLSAARSCWFWGFLLQLHQGAGKEQRAAHSAHPQPILEFGLGGKAGTELSNSIPVTCKG